jgi:hypothetical protein
MGGGTRGEVQGTRAFGSGYPYSVGEVSHTGVAGQPFPFGFWPIYWIGHGHSDEYGANTTVAAQRPGGNQVIVQIAPNVTSSTWNTTLINGVNETYWMIGDDESVVTLLSILVDKNATDLYGCGVQNLTIQPFNSSDPLNPVRFENVIQWYRASSFALAFTGYNNIYALPPLNETADLGWDDSTPLPDALQYSPFLQCINGTISAALPILDREGPALSKGQIAGIAVGSVFGALFLCCCSCCCFRKLKKIVKRSKPVVERTVVQGKQAYIVKNSGSKGSNFEKTLAPSPPRPTSHSPEALKLSSFNSTGSPPTAVTLQKPDLMKHGRESFYSSESSTLIAESGVTCGRKNNRDSLYK